MNIVREYGSVNGHIIGIVLKELVSRAINAIRAERFSFEAVVKKGYSGMMDDVQTSADLAAQEIYVRTIRECFPMFGIVAEEGDLRFACTHPHVNGYFTIDSLDGTRAFTRKQSHGVGTMISFVYDGVVIAVAIGDVNTREIFYYRPDSTNVWRVILEGNETTCEKLAVDTTKPLSDQYILLRDNPVDLSEAVQELTKSKVKGGKFKNISVVDGSIGMSMARLWKGEVVAHLLSGQQKVTPWDFCPILGISQMLGFVFLEIDPTSGALSIKDHKPITEIIDQEREQLIIHRDYLQQLGL